MLRSQSFRQTPVTAIDPTVGASQAGYREISGDVPSTGEQTRLLCWALVFDQQIGASAAYYRLVESLGEVGGDGLATASLINFPANRFGNMSERTGTIGELASLWVSGTTDGGDNRGAVLAAVDESLVQVLALSPYVASGNERAVHLIEHLAEAMASRQANLAMPPWADTMSRLPLLQDLEGILDNATIRFNRYFVPT